MSEKRAPHTPVIPANVPEELHQTFLENYQAITYQTGRLMLFAADQKIEHLNQDFYGPESSSDAADPEHLFAIASNGRIGAFATQLGLITRYGPQYPLVNYIAKLNSKTNLVPTEQQDPINAPLATVEDVCAVAQVSKLTIRGIGLTVYLGSAYEHEMLSYASQMIIQAHHRGLVAILWAYVRGGAIDDDNSPEHIAGAAGVAAALGADFVKVKAPHSTPKLSETEALKVAVQAAGNTKLICSGGAKTDPKQFLQSVHAQIHQTGAAGCATGRNIFQYNLATAIAMTQALSAIIYDDASAEQVYSLFAAGNSDLR